MPDGDRCINPKPPEVVHVSDDDESTVTIAAAAAAPSFIGRSDSYVSLLSDSNGSDSLPPRVASLNKKKFHCIF